MTRQQPGAIMRLAGRTLATPAVWWRHGETGRRLVLVLNMHLGEAAYWHAMRTRITELETAGWAVQIEGIRRAPGHEWAAATGAEQAAHQFLLERYDARLSTMAARLGWVVQGDKDHGLRPAAGWLCGDLTDLDAVRLAGPDAILAMAAAVRAAETRMGARRDLFAQAAGPLIWRALARDHEAVLAALGRFAPDVDAVLVGHRSKLAAAAVDPRRDTVMVWGGGHDATIGAALRAAGWQPSGRRRWLTVGRLPPYLVSVALLVPVAGHVGLATWQGVRSGEIDAEQAWAELKTRRAARG